jgi:hypothetical protein
MQMKVQFELVIGENKFTLSEDVENHSDFFKKLHFYSTLPKVGPNGETDLVLTYRVAQKQYEYYSIVSQKAQQEFKFGQSKESKGMLFAKGWEPLYKAENEEESTQPMQASAGLGAPAPAAQPSTQGIGQPAPQRSAAPTPAPAARTSAPTPAAAPAANPQVQTQAASILAKFGI